MKSHGICLSLTDLFNLTYYFPGPSMLPQKLRFPAFLWLSSIPLCKCTTAFWSSHLLMGTWAVSKSWLFIVNKTAMNPEVPVFCWTGVLWSLGYIPRSRIAGSKGSSIFNFLRKRYCFPQWLHQSAFPSTVGGSEGHWAPTEGSHPQLCPSLDLDISPCPRCSPRLPLLWALV